MEITFETLPRAVNEIHFKLEKIEQLLLEKIDTAAAHEPIWFNLNDLCEYLPDKPTKATVYGWVHLSLIPCHKGEKKLRFLKSEIDSWLKQGKKKTLAETGAEAEAYMKRKSPRAPIKKQSPFRKEL